MRIVGAMVRYQLLELARRRFRGNNQSSFIEGGVYPSTRSESSAAPPVRQAGL